MKTLYLVRHAKSDKNDMDLEDIDRPLNSRGYREAHMMGRSLDENKLLPDLIISSPAIRALTTALIFCRNFKMDPSEISINADLYETSVKQYLQVIKQTPDAINSVMLFAHNPTISDLMSAFIAPPTDTLPTCAVIGIQFPSDLTEWKKIDTAKGKLVLYDFPKNKLINN